MSDYTGDVSPGGQPATKPIGTCMRMTKVAVDPEMSNNCYLLTCAVTGEGVLIDAAAEPETLRRLIGDVPLTSIVTTHQHWDHHRALAEIAAEHPDAHLVAGAPDADEIEKQTGVTIDRRVADGDQVAVGTCDLSVIRLTGHTPGSIALWYDEDGGHLWTGDSLFPGGVGNTFGDADAFRTLVDDVEAKLFDALPDSTTFYPGHGGDSTLGAEKPHVAEWRARGW